MLESEALFEVVIHYPWCASSGNKLDGASRRGSADGEKTKENARVEGWFWQNQHVF